MPKPFHFTRMLPTAAAALIASFTLCAASLPGPAVDENRSEKKSETVVLAGGCFWGVQAVLFRYQGRHQRDLWVRGRKQSQRAL